MARLHSKKHGKSGKLHQKDTVPPKWVDKSPDEVVQIIVQLSRKGLSASQIGIELRDKYGIPNVKAVVGKSISKILKENGLSPKIPEDLMNLLKKVVRLNTHLKTHRSDVHNRVKLMHVESKVMRLIKYYKNNGILPADWKYSRSDVALFVK